MVSIINGKSNISLRLLDWFVTKYSRQYKIRYKNNFDKDGSYFNVHASYISQLGSFKKQYFDPFRRCCKFWFNYDKTNSNKMVYTTIGQLNFFKWAIEYDIIDYVECNYTKLDDAMSISNKEGKDKKLHKQLTESDSKSNTTPHTKNSFTRISNTDTSSLVISFE
jgi:hypothetical protein